MRSPRTATKSSPRSPQLEKACTQQRRPNAVKNKINKINKFFLKGKKEWTEERGRVEKSLRVQDCFGLALRLKINIQKLRKMDNDRACVHLPIILKSVIIRDRDVDWQLDAIGIDAPNLRWLKDQKLMSMKGRKWLGASLSDSCSSLWRQSESPPPGISFSFPNILASYHWQHSPVNASVFLASHVDSWSRKHSLTSSVT